MRSITLILQILMSLSYNSASMAEVVFDEIRSKAIINAINAKVRLPSEKMRDTDRKPYEVMKFSLIKPGDHVVEITPGEGYYTALLSRVVGEKGKIHAVDPARAFKALPRIRHFFPNYIKRDPRNNVEYSIQNLDEIQIPENLDQIWMVLYYHDTIWTEENRMAMNAAFFKHLKPGGVFLVIDHYALQGAIDSVTRSLHRIDADIVMSEVQSAGFILDASSDVLAHPEDPRTDSVFELNRRGKTDRFVWRFKKPHNDSSDFSQNRSQITN
ncbi:class I SAM-dependent methyltransferase [Marinicella sp. W31]|uniref:class I SAM-dependent methyltransferase n=1 Tax=Marinicella sp. W31 TaxID=3023713 RepID=UPI003756BB22